MPRLVVVVVAVLMVSPSRFVLAQEATPAPESGTIPPVVEEWAAAWAAEDLDRLMTLFAQEITATEVPTGFEVAGHPVGLRNAVGASLAAFDDVQVRLTDGFSAGVQVVVEGHFSGRYTG